MKTSRIITMMIVMCLIITIVPFWGCYIVGAQKETPTKEYEAMSLADTEKLGDNLINMNKMGKYGNVEKVNGQDYTGAQKDVWRMKTAAADTTQNFESNMTYAVVAPKKGTYLLSCRSKAENVIRSSHTEYFSYSVVAFVYYEDGTTKEYSTMFSYGTHGWEYRELSFTVYKPVRALNVGIYFRTPASGTAYFDDLKLICADDESGLSTFNDLPVESNHKALGQTTKATLKTKDGLEIGLGNTQVTELKIDGKSIVSDAFSGFLVRDVDYNNKSSSGIYSFKPSAASTPVKFSGETSSAGLGLTAEFKEADDHIEVSGIVTDTTNNKDGRSVELSYALPVSASGWKWGTSVLNSENVSVGKTSNVYKELGDGNLSVVDWDSQPSTFFPTTALYNEELGIAIATAMDFPCYWELEYNGSINSYVITYQLGITGEAPDSARFKFIIYKLDDPSYGFRSSMKKYGTVFKDYYTSNEDEHGLWLAWADVSNIPNVDDFGFRFKEISEDYRITGFFEKEHNIDGFYYIENGDWWISNLQFTSPEGIWNRINELTSGEMGSTIENLAAYQALATYGCAVLDHNGEITFNPVNVEWAPNGSQIHINANPKLPGNGGYNFYNLWMSEERKGKLFDPLKAGGLVFDGIYLDEMSGWWLGNANFNREHFKYTTVPLTYSPYYRRPMLRRASTTWEFVKELSKELRAIDKTLFANKCPDKHAFYVPLIDAMGTEQTAHNGTAYNPQSIKSLSTWRTLSYTKPFSILFNNDYNIITHDLMEKYFARCLPFAIFPSPCMNYGDGTFYWSALNKFYERDRDIFQKYIPALKSCSEAGWEPVTYAETDDKELVIERYGNDDKEGIHFVIYNDSGSEKNVEVKLDLSKFNISAGCETVNMLYGEKAVIENGVYKATLKGDESVCIRIFDPAKQTVEDDKDNSASNGSNTVGGGNGASGNNGSSGSFGGSENQIGQATSATNKITEITKGADVLKIIKHHLTNQLDEFNNKETYKWTVLLIVVDLLIAAVGALLILCIRKKRRLNR